MKLNQEQKDYLLKVEAEINKMFYEVHDLLSEETNNLMADGLDALSSEVVPLWEEKIRNDKQTDLNFELDKLNMDL
tara:strand:- start:68 stop:295 length:228 start_codon:yes stop_codon:yes gene_type:complete